MSLWKVSAGFIKHQSTRWTARDLAEPESVNTRSSLVKDKKQLGQLDPNHTAL